jgi:carboxymethylenebutenolidase
MTHPMKAGRRRPPTQGNEVVTERIYLPARAEEKPMSAYLARPAADGEYPAVIVCMGILGVTSHIRTVADRVARAGYLAVAPDFYHRIAPGTELPSDDQGAAGGMALMRQLRQGEVVDDLRTTIDYLRRRTDTTGRVGAIGFGIGGHIAFLAASQFDVPASVSFYGGWMTGADMPLGQTELAPGLARNGGRLLFLVGELDHLLTREQCDGLDRALDAANARHEIVIYPGAKHGFFGDESEAFDPSASDDSWERVCKLLEEELTG